MNNQEVTNADIMQMLQTILNKNESLEKRIDSIENKLEEHGALLYSSDSRLSILEGEEVLNKNSVEHNEPNPETAKSAKRNAAISNREDYLEDEKSSNGSMPDTSDSEKINPDGGKSKRKSVFLKTVERTTAMAERRHVVMQMPTPSFSHIRLESTDLSEYCQFVNKWFDYEVKHGIKLSPTSIISDRIRNLLIYTYDLDDTDFNSLTPERFCSLMAKETIVLSKTQFAETFKHAMRNVKVLSWENVKPNNHEIFFQGILRRKKIFLRTFQILMEANSQYCPSIEGKDYGLAQVFLSLVDSEYNKLVLAEIPKIKPANYPRVEEFIDAYVKQAKEHFDKSKLVRSVPYQGDGFKRFQVTSYPKRDGQYVSNNRFPQTSSQSLNKQQFRSNSFNADKRSLSQMNVVDIANELDNSDEEFPPPDFEDNDLENQKDLDDIEEESLIDKDNPTDNHVEESIVPLDNNSSNESLMALLNVNPQTFSKHNKGCVQYVLGNGHCSYGDKCYYASSHNAQGAELTRQWMLARLKHPGYKEGASVETAKWRMSKIDPSGTLDHTGSVKSASNGNQKSLYQPSATHQYPRKIVRREKVD